MTGSAAGPAGPTLRREVGEVSLATQSRYLIKRNFWSIFERKFRILTPDGQLVLFVQHPVFKLREEFMIYRDEAKTTPVFKLKSTKIIAINYAFEITDAVTGALHGSVQKRGLRSLVQDKFHIFDAAGTQIGEMEEQGHTILRRFIPLLTSQHSITLGGAEIARITQQFRFFNKEFWVDVKPGQVPHEFVLACALLALMAEARREGGGGSLALLDG